MASRTARTFGPVLVGIGESGYPLPMRGLLPALLALGVATLAGCPGDEGPPPIGSLERDAGNGGGTGGGSTLIDAGFRDGPPDPDASGLCGNLIIPVIVDRPNLYWIVDRSGSMNANLAGSAFTKFVNARIAIADVLRAIGHRVNVGASLFPSPFSPDPICGPGEEIFPTQPGDPLSFSQAGEDGPALKELLRIFAGFGPNGGTPISSALETVRPTLTSLEGETAVVLVTDGAPNCNANAVCSADLCGLNLAGSTVQGVQCIAPVNCCDPAFLADGPASCVDSDATKAAVTSLFDAGIRTYVVGMPGSELFSNLLDELAVAGGTPRETSPLYYTVSGADDLSSTLLEIGVDIAISCTIDLETEPPDPESVNVYLDLALTLFDEIDGWSFSSPTTVEINGAACDRLKSGAIGQVQVVAGCPTAVP